MDFKGKKVLVAGGTGLIGIPLVKMLIEEEGAKVTIVSLDSIKRAHPNARFLHADLTDLGNCKSACYGMDYVFNLLCVKGSPDAMRKYPATFFEKNLLLDIQLLRAASATKSVRGYLLASSLAVYPPAPVFRENAVWGRNPSRNDWYAGWAKRMGELQVEAHQQQFGDEMKISIVRPTNTYGPYDNFNPENAMVVPSLIRRAVGGENPLIVKGDGSEVRDFLHARDVARGMLLVAKAEHTTPVNLGSGSGVLIRDLVIAVAMNVNPIPNIEWDATAGAGDAIRVMNIERARSLGFEPKIPLEDGIYETVEWYRSEYKNVGKQYNPFK